MSQRRDFTSEDVIREIKCVKIREAINLYRDWSCYVVALQESVKTTKTAAKALQKLQCYELSESSLLQMRVLRNLGVSNNLSILSMIVRKLRVEREWNSAEISGSDSEDDVQYEEE
nr:hypothetical protein Iba_chr02cCG2190 [Ipomoea batatas]